MVPDRLCVPGLDRPVTVSEYATLKGVREAEVLAAIRALKIRSAYSNEQWYIEAPPNCEARLAQLRGVRPSPDSSDKTGTTKQPSSVPWRAPINERMHDEPERLLKVRREQASPGESEVERLRIHFVKSHWRYDRLTPAQQEALLTTKQYAERPQPIDYYREKEFHEWRWIFFVAFVIYAGACGGMLYLHDSGQLTGTSAQIVQLALVLAPVSLIGSVMLFSMTEGFIDAYRRRRSMPGYLRYQEALQLHELYQSTAQAAAHEAEQAILRMKRSYWEFLDGYAFEKATAEVLERHQFNARVTGGSADGGIDIVVTRGGRKGVVQCKGHVACIGPHVVRDLYGVIHHSRADFGIIVSRGGFSKGAVDFAREKPIFFLDISDLIAMQEGRDVLAAAFSGSSSVTRS
jgi:hypothetical protein